MEHADTVITRYLQGQGPHRLEIGAGANGKPGWLATDLHATDNIGGAPIVALDATKYFPIPSDSFDFVYAEHMIEHISFDSGLDMLAECHRVLKPEGTLRVVTPSLGFLCRVISPDRSQFEDRYREWSVKTFVPKAPAVTNAIFLNNFVRAWGHIFVYDRETLFLAMQLAGFGVITECAINESENAPMRELENETRLPAGFLALESMVVEGLKGQKRSLPGAAGRNLALGKGATQSSVSLWSRGGTPEEDASRVVSGNLTGSYNNHTGLDDPAWWRVDLEHTCRISQIRIYNRIDDNRDIMRRTNHFEIQTSDDECFWKPVLRKTSEALVGSSKYAPYVWTPDETVLARFVRIQLIGKQFLHLDQVEIFGNE